MKPKELIDTLQEIEKGLDKTFKRSCLADDDDEPPVPREVWALENAVRGILAYLRDKESNAE